MSRLYVRKLTSESSNTNKFNGLKQELTDLRLKELKQKRVKNKSHFVKRAKRRNKYRKQETNAIDELLAGYSIALETNLPKSEIWFRELYSKENIVRKHLKHHFVDCFNRPFNRKYIPDVSNQGYRYIIEIDGSIHDLPEVKYNDSIKDYYYSKRGYCVIRIKAFDEQSYKDGIEKLKAQIAYIETEVVKWKT